MKTFEFTGEQKDQIEWLLKAFKADNLRYDQAFNQLKSIVSERITPEPKAMTEQEITNKEIYELECILEKVRKGGFMYTFAEAINDIENIFKPFMVQSAQITPEPGESGQKRESPFIGEITISDLRKLFAHRASRISEDINQGANQLMTLTDFRLALADMRWRIYNDGLSEPGESGQSAEDVESIFYKLCDIARRDGASIEYLTKPNAIEAMRLHASQVCADKEQEIDRINESLTVMVNRNAELEKELEYAKIR